MLDPIVHKYLWCCTLCMPWAGDVFLHIVLKVDNSIMYLMKKTPFLIELIVSMELCM